VIVCGDFNDPPFAYTYNHISDDLKDSFRESGKGTGKTYHGDIYPSFRIDYILHNSNFNSYGHNIYTDLKISDHYPISCYISLIKK
jgi:endonuclease/exonuclease/phosphatase family metal-dependent hydrolase